LIVENREFAGAPDFRINSIKDLPREWDQYFKDRMPFRQIFMPGYIFTYEKLLKTYVSEYVTGKGDELFMNHAASVVDNALGIAAYPAEWKEKLRLSFAGKHAYFMSKGIPYYLFLVPDKTTLYPELMPLYANWIPHRTWYQEQVATLSKANIRFYPLNDFFWQFKDHERLYDIMFDNAHWNGNTLGHVYDYMAKILAKDNPVFKPVPFGEYYSLEHKDIVVSVYGKERTKFISLNHAENFSCSGLGAQYQTRDYNKICTNNTVPAGSLWFFSDSYFGGTHGSYGITPFVHNVHTYMHRHYKMGNMPFTKLADRTLLFNRPDAVIEEFVERMGDQTELAVSDFDPLVRILGDFWMKTNGVFLEHRTNLSAFELKDIDRSDSAPEELIAKPGNRLSLKTAAAADDLGRVTVMGKISAPSSAGVRIYWRNESGTEKTQDFRIAQGPQIFHETLHVKPFSKVNISLQFLTPGKYRLEKIQEIDDLRERM